MVLVTPFENVSRVPGIEWIGESFPEILGQRFTAAALFVISRNDRVYAYDRLGIPSAVRPSRATLFRISEAMDVDYVVVGRFDYDGRRFTARAQVMDMKRLHLSPEAVESGGMGQLLEIQNALAWDLLRDMDQMFAQSKNEYVRSIPPVRLDALENYIRGTIAAVPAERIKYLRQAVQVTPDYAQALVNLGKTYFEGRDYVEAVNWLARVPRSDPSFSEASFYLGLSNFYLGKFDRAEEAFQATALRVPLIEVYNNLGVAAARQGKKTALELFQRAAEADSRDADYRFNLGVAWYRAGNLAEAQSELKQALALAPQDAEAKSLLEQAMNNAPFPAPGSPHRAPLERVKRNYDETSFRQLALEVENAAEQRFSLLPRPEHAAAHVKRGHELLSQGFFLQAESQFREAILLAPNLAAAHSGLARALEPQDALEEARSEANAANRLAPSAEAFLVLARIEMKQNRYDAARESVERALKLEPNNTDAPGLLQAIQEAGPPPKR